MRRYGTVDDGMTERSAQIVFEIQTVFDGLKTNQIVGKHGFDEIGVVRHRTHGAAIRPWRVQEETERTIDTVLAHLRAQSEKVVILDPEHRFGRVEADQCARHESVDFAIGLVVLGGDVDEIGARVQSRP
jgi:hypothetical protein